MADLRIHHIESRSSQPAGQPWPVTVALNNLETVAFAWESGTCNENGEPGHKASVTLTIRDSNGAKVWSETKETCIPRNRVGQMLGANKRLEFNPSVDSPGGYTLTASVEAINSVGGDTSDPVQVTVTGVEETEQVDNGNDNGGDSNGLTPLGDADGDGTPNMMDPAPQNPDKPAGGGLPSLGLSTTQQAGLAVVAVLVVMLIARPYASLGSEVVG